MVCWFCWKLAKGKKKVFFFGIAFSSFCALQLMKEKSMSRYVFWLGFLLVLQVAPIPSCKIHLSIWENSAENRFCLHGCEQNVSKMKIMPEKD